MKKAPDREVGLTITTAEDASGKIFAPHAPPIADRAWALSLLQRAGIRTFVMIAPMLPGARGLVGMLEGSAGHILLDRLDDHDADWAFKKQGDSVGHGRFVLQSIGRRLEREI